MGLIEFLFLPVTLPLGIVRGLVYGSKVNNKPPPPSPDDPRFSCYMENARGQLLRIYKWKARTVTTTTLRGIMFISHGFNEHLGRYHHVAEFFNKEGFDVYGIDHSGHGMSAGNGRARVERFEDCVDDYAQFVRQITAGLTPSEKALPKVLLGHSMGGLISVLLSNKHPDLFDTVMLSGPLLMIDPKKAHPALVAVGRILRRFVPWLPMERIEPTDVCGDANVVYRYKTDPLPSQMGVPVTTAMEFVDAVARIPAIAARYSVPFAIYHGQEDKLTLLAGSQMLYESSPLPRDKKRLVIYPNMKHETIQDVEWVHVCSDMMAWLNQILKK